LKKLIRIDGIRSCKICLKPLDRIGAQNFLDESFWITNLIDTHVNSRLHNSRRILNQLPYLLCNYVYIISDARLSPNPQNP